MKKAKCPCCGYYTLKVTNGSHEDEICQVCFWHSNFVQDNDPNFSEGAHEMSLNEAKQNYQKVGTVSSEYLSYVRKPMKDELPENN